MAELTTEQKINHALEFFDGKLDWIAHLVQSIPASRASWRVLGTDRPKMGDPTNSGAAIHSRYVLVRQDNKYFVAQFWVRLLDGAECWIPTFTYERVPATAADAWLPLEEI